MCSDRYGSRLTSFPGSLVARLPADRRRDLVAAVLFLTAPFIVPLARFGRVWTLPWLALFAAAAAVFLRGGAGRSVTERRVLEGLLLLLALLHMLVAATGGVHSPWWIAYPAVIPAAFYRLERLRDQLAVLGAICYLEWTRVLLFAPPGVRAEDAERLAAATLLTLLAGLAVSLLFGRERRRLRREIEGHRRLEEDAEEFRRLEEYHRDPAPGELSARDERARVLSSVVDLDQVFGELCGLARRSLRGRTAALFLLTGGGDVLTLRAADTAEPESTPVDPDASMKLGEGVVGGAAKVKRPVLLGSVGTRDRTVAYYRGEHRPRSLVIAPVLEAGVLRGVLLADGDRKDAFSRGDQDLLERFAAQVAAALERARARGRRQEQSHRLELLRSLSNELSSTLKLEELLERMVDRLSDVAPYDQCALFLAEPRRRLRLQAHRGLTTGEKEIVVSWEKGLAGYIATHRRTLLFSDLRERRRRVEIVPGLPGRERIRSFMGVPIQLKDGLIGVILLTSSEPGRFLSHHLDTLAVVANQAAVLISNAFLHRKVETLAVTDGLTGLFNHRHFQEILAHELERADRHQGPVSLLILDLDHFKKINDRCGHPFGDTVLKGVSRRLLALARKIDFVARYGGEEFAIIMSHTGRRGCRTMARRILAAVRAEPYTYEGRAVSVTVSVGSATFPEDAREREELIRRADQALYFAKESGRDRYMAYTDIG